MHAKDGIGVSLVLCGDLFGSLGLKAALFDGGAQAAVLAFGGGEDTHILSFWGAFAATIGST